MDAERFDALTRSLSFESSRRGVLSALTGSLVALELAAQESPAKKKKKKKPCPLCRTRKKGKCKGKVQDGTSCGTERECQGGTCVCTGSAGCQPGEACQSNTCLCGANPGCNAVQRCEDGTCVTGIGTCEVGQDTCGTGLFSCQTNPEVPQEFCRCFTSAESGTRCGTTNPFPGQGCLDPGCTSDADCATRHPTINGVFCTTSTSCCVTPKRLCVSPCP